MVRQVSTKLSHFYGWSVAVSLVSVEPHDLQAQRMLVHVALGSCQAIIACTIRTLSVTFCSPVWS